MTLWLAVFLPLLAASPALAAPGLQDGWQASAPADSTPTAAALRSAPAGGAPAKVLTQVSQVRRLSYEQAARHLPVRIRGVVTTFSGWAEYFFLQDKTGGIALLRSERQPVHVGDEVEVSGVTDPGKFAASLNSQRVRVLGRGKEPPARIFTYMDMVGGSQDSQWVGIQGLVESAEISKIWDHTILVLEVEAGGGLIEVRLMQFDPSDVARLVDARVTVRGVCGTIYNNKRQFTGLRMFVPSSRYVKVLDPGPTDPFALPLSPMRTVLQYGPNSHAGHRIKVAGTLTYQEPGHSLYLQDGKDGILLSTAQTTTVPLGTRIEAVGFPTMGSYSPKLRNVTFRVAGPVQPIVPARIHASEFIKQEDTFSYSPYEGQLVRLEGTLISPVALVREDAWMLREGEGDFVADLQRQPGAPPLPSIAVGSKVAVTGIYMVVVDEDRRPRAFKLLLRTPADLVVIRGPSWWTPRHLAVVLALVLLGAMAATLWSMQLRRRVHEQTLELRESEERFRKQAQQDLLTGAASRAFLLEKLEGAIVRARRHGGRLGVLMIDLDHFKQVNDTMGHHAGDELLRVVADRIQMSVRKSDIVARMGGDEFVVLLADLTDAAEAEMIGAKVVANVSAPADIEGKEMPISASVGVCTYPEGGLDRDTLLQNVDQAMYKAKAGGRNSFSVHMRADLALGAGKKPGNSRADRV